MPGLSSLFPRQGIGLNRVQIDIYPEEKVSKKVSHTEKRNSARHFPMKIVRVRWKENRRRYIKNQFESFQYLLPIFFCLQIYSPREKHFYSEIRQSDAIIYNR